MLAYIHSYTGYLRKGGCVFTFVGLSVNSKRCQQILMNFTESVIATIDLTIWFWWSGSRHGVGDQLPPEFRPPLLENHTPPEILSHRHIDTRWSPNAWTKEGCRCTATQRSPNLIHEHVLLTCMSKAPNNSNSNIYKWLDTVERSEFPRVDRTQMSTLQEPAVV